MVLMCVVYCTRSSMSQGHWNSGPPRGAGAALHQAIHGLSNRQLSFIYTCLNITEDCIGLVCKIGFIYLYFVSITLNQFNGFTTKLLSNCLQY